jgi:hypothetical protein
MEVEGKTLWLRSVADLKLRYCMRRTLATRRLYKAYASVVALHVQPYGAGIEIVKHECVGHVQKRLGSALRKLKKTGAIDGHPVKFKGKFTDKSIKLLSGMQFANPPLILPHLAPYIKPVYQRLSNRHTGCNPESKWELQRAVRRVVSQFPGL